MNKDRIDAYVAAMSAVNDPSVQSNYTMMNRTMDCLRVLLDNISGAVTEGEGSEACVYLDSLIESCREIFEGLSEDIDKNQFVNDFNALQFARMENGFSGRVVPPEV